MSYPKILVFGLVISPRPYPRVLLTKKNIINNSLGWNLPGGELKSKQSVDEGTQMNILRETGYLCKKHEQCEGPYIYEHINHSRKQHFVCYSNLYEIESFENSPKFEMGISKWFGLDDQDKGVTMLKDLPIDKLGVNFLPSLKFYRNILENI